MEDRRVVFDLQKKLTKLGHTVHIVSCDNEYNTNKQLNKIVNATNKINPDLLISIHLNSFHDPSANGVEVYHHPTSTKGKEYAEKVQRQLVTMSYTDRGVKSADFVVLRDTVCPAILVECGFITSKHDMAIFDPSVIADKIIYAITGEIVYNEIAKDIFYRVIAGSYKDKNNALRVEKELKEKGYNAFLEAKEV